MFCQMDNILNDINVFRRKTHFEPKLVWLKYLKTGQPAMVKSTHLEILTPLILTYFEPELSL